MNLKLWQCFHFLIMIGKIFSFNRLRLKFYNSTVLFPTQNSPQIIYASKYIDPLMIKSIKGKWRKRQNAWMIQFFSSYFPLSNFISLRIDILYVLAMYFLFYSPLKMTKNFFSTSLTQFQAFFTVYSFLSLNKGSRQLIK